MFSTSKKITVSVGDDLFNSAGVEPVKKREDIDDLFATTTKMRSGRGRGEEDLFASGDPVPKAQTRSQPTANVNVFDSPPEDIFAASVPSSDVGSVDIFASSAKDVGVSDSKKLDELLGSPSRKGGKTTKGAKDETDAGKVSGLSLK